MLFPGHEKSLALGTTVERMGCSRNGSTRLYGTSNGREPMTPESGEVEDFVPANGHLSAVDETGTTTSRMLWIRNIPMSTTGHMLEEVFRDYGEIESTDPTGVDLTPRGFGNVLFKQTRNAVRAWKYLNGKKLFQNSGVPVVIWFDNTSDSAKELVTKQKESRPNRSTSPVDRINEWFTPKVRPKPKVDVAQEYRDVHTEKAGPRSNGVNSDTAWPNGPPPRGPKGPSSRLADVSPASRRPDIYRRESGYDSYRPDNDRHSQERRSFSYDTSFDRGGSRYPQHEYENQRGDKTTPSFQDCVDGIDRDRDRANAQGTRKMFPGSLQWKRDATEQKVELNRPESNHGVSRIKPIDPGQIAPPAKARSSSLGKYARREERRETTPVHQSLNNNIKVGPPSSSARYMPMDEGSEDADYSPERIRESPAAATNPQQNDIPGHESTTTLSRLELLPDISLSTVVIGGSTPNAGPMSLSDLSLLSEKHFRQNDDTFSLRSEATTCTRTGASVSSTARKKKHCITCTRSNENFPLYKCQTCRKRCHEHCGVVQSEVPKTTVLCGPCGHNKKKEEVKDVANSNTQPVAKARAKATASHFSDAVQVYAQISQVSPTFDRNDDVPLTRERKNGDFTADLSCELHPDTIPFIKHVECAPSSSRLERGERDIPQPAPTTRQFEETQVLQASTSTLQVSQTDTIVQPVQLAGKRVTCKFWKRGFCHFSADQCHFAHRETGIDLDPRHYKTVTCFYWRKNGHCRNSDEDCLYSHFDTGAYASEPTKWARPDTFRPRQSSEFQEIQRPDSLTASSLNRGPGLPNGEANVPIVNHSMFYSRPSLINKYKESQDDAEDVSTNGQGRVVNFQDEESVHIAQENRSNNDQHSTTKLGVQKRILPDRNPALVPLPNDRILTRTGIYNAEVGSTKANPDTLAASNANGTFKSPSPPRSPHYIRENEMVSPADSMMQRGESALDPRRRRVEPVVKPLTAGTTRFHQDQTKAFDERPNGLTAASTGNIATSGDSASASTKLTRKCRDCSKLIFASNVLLCKSCCEKGSDDKTTQIPDPLANLEAEFDEVFASSDVQLGAGSIGLGGVSRESLNNGHINEIRRDIDALKLLKRSAPADNMFISNKKRKVFRPAFPGRTEAEKTLPTPVSPMSTAASIPPFEQPAKPIMRIKPPTLLELTAIEQAEKNRHRQGERQSTESVQSPQLEGSKVAQKPSGEIENAQPLPVNSLPIAEKYLVLERSTPTQASPPEEVAALLANEAVPSVNKLVRRDTVDSEASDDIDPLQRQELNLQRVPPQQKDRPQADIAAKQTSFNNKPSLSRQSSGMLSNQGSPKKHMPSVHKACDDCSRRRIRCLHQSNGKWDGDLCRKYRIDFKNKVDTKRTLAELEAIRLAASGVDEAGGEETDTFYSAPEEDSSEESSSEEEEDNEDDERDILRELTPPERSRPLKEFTRAPPARPESMSSFRALPERKTKARPSASSFWDGLGPMTSTEWTKKDERAALAELEKRGVQFDMDSDSDQSSDEEAEWTRWTTKSGDQYLVRDPLRQPPRASRDLFDIASEYLNLPSPEKLALAPPPPLIIDRVKRGRRKAEWHHLLKTKCLERQLRYGNKHWEVERPENQRKVKAIEEGRMLPVAPGRGGLDVVLSESREVEMSFEEFMGMPEKPVACLVGEKMKVLAFRDGGKDERGRKVVVDDEGRVKERRVRVTEGDRWVVGGRG